MTPRPLYKTIASLLTAYANCVKTGNSEWESNHRASLDELVDSFMPSGSGVDNGTKLDFDRSHSERLVFTCGYHHMNDGGMYDGWTEHTVKVTPSLVSGFDVNVSGRNRNDIKSYLAELFDYDLSQLVQQDADGKWHSNRYEALTV